MPKTIKPQDVKEAAKNKNTLILDVRRKTDKEASTDSIPGAEWHDPEKIDEWIDSLPPTAEPVIYCMRGGAISQEITAKLEAKGYKACYIEGGINAWKDAEGDKK